MMSDKLRPCPNPWCKTSRPQRIRTEETIACVVRSRVECTCGAKGPMCDTEDEAIATWNHRPVEDALVDALTKARRWIVEDKFQHDNHCAFICNGGPPCDCPVPVIDAALKLAKKAVEADVTALHERRIADLGNQLANQATEITIRCSHCGEIICKEDEWGEKVPTHMEHCEKNPVTKLVVENAALKVRLEAAEDKLRCLLN